MVERLTNNSLSSRLHVDLPLLIGIIALLAIGLITLYSASTHNVHLLEKQAMRLGGAMVIMLLIAQVHPRYFAAWAAGLYCGGLLLLVAVLVLGDIGKGAQRWLDLGIFRFQPSELMKIAVPMMLASYLGDRPLPPRFGTIMATLGLACLPALLIAKQPDLGTAILIGVSGCFVLFLAGLSWRWIFGSITLAISLTPALWYFMHDYQRQRVLTFINPESDPLGSGYHIIQSKIAIGSGGLFGKGWLNGTQSHLQFLPEHSTDFIFAVFGEEFGLAGSIILLGAFLLIIARGLYISTQAQNSFARLLSGSLILIFFCYVFINIGMVSGILPVVGIPLPLVSYGGTSMVTILASFGILMSIHSHRKLLAN